MFRLKKNHWFYQSCYVNHGLYQSAGLHRWQRTREEFNFENRGTDMYRGCSHSCCWFVASLVMTSDQWSVFSWNITYVTRKIIYFYYQKMCLQDESVQSIHQVTFERNFTHCDVFSCVPVLKATTIFALYVGRPQMVSRFGADVILPVCFLNWVACTTGIHTTQWCIHYRLCLDNSYYDKTDLQ